MSAQNGEQCNDCRYFHKRRDFEHWGDCRRHAPVVSLIEVVTTRPYRMNGDEPAGDWPKVQNAYWCGDFVMRGAEQRT